MSFSTDKCVSCDDAIKFNHFECFINRTTYPYDVYFQVAEKGNVEMFKWLFDNNVKSTHLYIPFTIVTAARKGNLDIVKYLHSKKITEYSDQALKEATENGHFHVVEFLKNNI
jgi:hypothetical protein